jgi:glycosyltransferase involved in cell wall biosynthesis
MVARHLLNQTESYNVVHTWPLATLRTAKAAKQFGIPVALERCNAHTRYAYNSVKEECDRIGIHLPRNFEHQKNTKILSLEESEYESASIILCPSDFVVKTFLAEGFPINKLKRFFYGVDTSLFYPQATNSNENSPLTVLFVGICAVRKGLHIALRAWIESEASRNGRFIIAGNFLPEYQRLLTPLLKHPSISILGHRSDIPHLMRNSDVFILPSVEEGFGLVCTEAIASGCVPLVSQACTDLCQHRHNSLVHPIGDIDLLSAQLTLLYRDRDLLKTLRQNGIAERSRLSWESAGRHLRKVYNDISH